MPPPPRTGEFIRLNPPPCGHPGRPPLAAVGVIDEDGRPDDPRGTAPGVSEPGGRWRTVFGVEPPALVARRAASSALRLRASASFFTLLAKFHFTRFLKFAPIGKSRKKL